LGVFNKPPKKKKSDDPKAMEKRKSKKKDPYGNLTAIKKVGNDSESDDEPENNFKKQATRTRFADWGL
jgi:hypothetical protein